MGLICWIPLCALCTPVGGTLLTIFIFGVAGIISYSKHKERTGGNNGISQKLTRSVYGKNYMKAIANIGNSMIS